MSGTSPNHSLPRPAAGSPGDDPAPRYRWRRFAVQVGGVALLAVAALLAAALIPGSHAGGASGQPRPVKAATGSSTDPLPTRVSKVYGSNISARTYGTQVADRENGVAANGQLISDLTPLAPRQFDRPVAQYKAYAERWAVTLGHDAVALTAVLRTGQRAVARRDWMTAFSDYLHLGAVYGFLPTGLNDRLAQVPSATSDVDFPGLHRIEKGLWTGQSLRSLVPVSAGLGRAVLTLRRVLRSVTISPLDYATRAHEILEDSQRDLMSGTDVPWSGEGVLGTAAGLAATEKMISTLVPLLDGRDNTLGVTQYWLARFQKVLGSVRRHNGTYPTLVELSSAQLQLIDGTLAGTLGALSAVPGTLETKQIPRIPNLPVATK